MKINTLQRYGLRAMIEISLYTDKEGIFQKDIATHQKLSNRYLDHIISRLKAAGLIKKYHGRRSGYILSRPAEDISVLDILKAFMHDIEIVDCIESEEVCEKTETCIAGKFWGELNEIIKDYLQNHTLKELSDKQLIVNKEVKNQSDQNP